MIESSVRILIVEDEPQIVRFVRSALEDEGWQVFAAANAKSGLIEAGTRKPDLVILDLGLPDMDGMEFIRDFRNWTSVPVLILSARGGEDDKIRALDQGADDYLVKPFGIGELLARVRALLRRQARGEEPGACLSIGEIEIDLARRIVLRRGEEVHLTPVEYRLFSLLAANAGKVLTQRHLLRQVWGPTYADSNHYLRIYVGHLRRKLEDDPAQPRHLLTETGVGYRLQP